MVKKSALKQKPISFSVNKNRIRKVGRRMHQGKTKVVPETVFSGLYYDPNLSATQNMVKYGLCPDPNMKAEKVKEMVDSVPEQDKKMLPYHHLLREEEDSIWKHIVTPQEQMFLQELGAKYGRDYKKMSFDIKLNPFQYTPKQLQKKFEKFDKYVQFETERVQSKLKRAQERAEKRKLELEEEIARAAAEEEAAQNEDDDEMSGDDDNDEESDQEDLSHLASDEVVDYDDSDDDEEAAAEEDDDDESEDEEAIKLEMQRLAAKKQQQQSRNKQKAAPQQQKKKQQKRK